MLRHRFRLPIPALLGIWVALASCIGEETFGAQGFTVNPPVPTLTSLTPNTGVQGATRNATLVGSGFVAGATSVAIDGTDVAVANVRQ